MPFPHQGHELYPYSFSSLPIASTDSSDAFYLRKKRVGREPTFVNRPISSKALSDTIWNQALYRDRRNIEVNPRNLKITLEIDILRGKTPEAIE